MNLASLLYAFAGYYNNLANSNDKADNNFPLIDKLLAFQSKGILIVYQNFADTLQYLEGFALNTSESCFNLNLILDNGVSNS